jgi:pimeloyl-ACP methyl ester carboxylesterase
MKALFIHGVGRQDPDFANDARHWLRPAVSEPWFQSVYWAGMADRVQNRFMKDVEARGSKLNPSQKLVIGTLADALMYRSENDLQRKLFGLLDYHSDRFGGADYTVFAHSLGGLIFTDWLRTRPEQKRVRLVTMGCNIGLFTLGNHFQPVKQLEVPNHWINVYSPRDMLGFPLTVDPNLKHVHDVEVSVGGWFRGWTGLAHTLYWSDEDLWRITLPKLLA